MDRLDEKVLKAYEGVVTKQEVLLNEGKLTKKDFDSLAALMKSSTTLEQLKTGLVSWAGKFNPMFNAERFKKAANMNEELNEIGKAEYKKGQKVKVTSGDSEGKVGIIVKSKGTGMVVKTSTGEINVPVDAIKVISNKEYSEAE